MRLLILSCVLLIFALGLMMVYNTTTAEILDRSLQKNMHQALFRQICYGLVGCLLAFLVWRVGFDDLLRLSPVLLAFFCFLLILVFIPGIGKVRNGAHRWVGLGNFTLQPSEFVKYLVLLVYIEWSQNRPATFLNFCKIVGLLAIPILMVMIEPDNGAAAVMGASLIPLFFITHIRFKYWALPVLVLMSIGSIAAFKLPYVRARLEVYLHPELDLKGKGHQPHQAKIAAGSGGLLGRGPGASLQKLTYLPEAKNDYIAAIYAEEFGFLGVAFLILVYMLFAFGGFSIAMKSKNVAACYVACAITSLIALQAFLNLAVVSGLLPSKGVNLPFFSQGGTSLIANIIGLTILLQIGRHEEKSDFERRGNRRPSLPCPSSGERAC